jgi:5-formyltetrahydrofolate cyclo-ligase
MARPKTEIRESVWRRLTEEKAARFPGAPGRIPNFVGAAQAAERLTTLDVWQSARVIKCNPDSPQQPLRKRALEEGKVLYMAVPRLASQRCFLELDPDIVRNPYFASTIKGAFKAGRPVHPREMRPIDLVVCGAVAVRRDGARLGKGGGYSDLEYALVRALGLLDPSTPITTTVHPCQVLDEPVPMARHDIVVDYAATPEELIICEPVYARPRGIYWDDVGEKLQEVPVLQEMAEVQGL